MQQGRYHEKNVGVKNKHFRKEEISERTSSRIKKKKLANKEEAIRVPRGSRAPSGGGGPRPRVMEGADRFKSDIKDADDF